MPTQRVLEWFRLRGDQSLVGEIELKGITLRELKTAFKFDSKNPDRQMVMGYRVTEDQREFLESRLAKKLDLRRFQYFVAAFDVP